MSHAPERKEKDCLNCGALVQGRFCAVCGQENVVPHESFGSMVHHFLADITHFDGKFFSTVGILILKPGFLSKEWVRGRRNSYLNPVRMYVFTSALFFLIFFTVYNPHKIGITPKNGKPGITRSLLETGYKNAGTKEDSMAIQKALSDLDSMEAAPVNQLETGKGLHISTKLEPPDSNYKTVREYDSVQQLLSSGKRDGWFKRTLKHKTLDLQERYRDNESEFWMTALGKFEHSFPYLLFVSLPLYALFLKLLYIRKKRFYYADHGIFLIHLCIFSFIFLLLLIGLSALADALHLGWMQIVQFLLFIAGLFYALKALKFFYEQRWAKTILKFILFNLLCVLTLAVLFAVFFVFSIFRL